MKTLLSWSSGKDSAWALHVLRQRPEIDVVGLFCTFNEKFSRGAMHAVKTELIEQQAKMTGLPLRLIPIPNQCSDSKYKTIMSEYIQEVKSQNVEAIAFGDLFLEDVRDYRESNLSGTGITPLFPLWGTPTEKLSKDMIASGLKAKITSIDPQYLSEAFAGHEYNAEFLDQLPDNVDPCGENGEFHSFVYGGPMFKEMVHISLGETVKRDGFIFKDLLPG
jgi:uncharacterized protein (TIGR00290 family)